MTVGPKFFRLLAEHIGKNWALFQDYPLTVIEGALKEANPRFDFVKFEKAVAEHRLKLKPKPEP